MKVQKQKQKIGIIICLEVLQGYVDTVVFSSHEKK
jgi:hypothetical protein